MCFPNAAIIPLAKALFRKVTIEGHNGDAVTTSLMDAISADGLHKGLLLSAAAEAYGGECLQALVQGLAAPSEITSLHHENMPVIFLPNPQGGDIQITPVSPASSYMVMKGLADDLDPRWTSKRKKVGEAAGEPQRRGRFAGQTLSGSPQNISGMIGGPRMRFMADFPAPISAHAAAIRRMVMGGEPPALRDIAIVEIMRTFVRFAGLVDDVHRKPELVAAAENTSRAALEMIASHVLDCIDACLAVEPAFQPKEINLKLALLKSIPRTADGHELIRQSTAHRIFAAQLQRVERQFEISLEQLLASADRAEAHRTVNQQSHGVQA